MSDRIPTTILAIPNLQGERFSFEIENSQVDWVDSAHTLQHQVDKLKTEYNGQQLLIGTSFGALAAWKCVVEQCPPTLKGVILIDVLPSLDVFPKRREIGFSVLTRFPSRISQLIYNFYRSIQNRMPTEVTEVLSRVQSLQKEFPHPCFPIPTLVVSTNRHFHDVWRQMSKDHNRLTVQEKSTISIQIQQWVEDGVIA